MKDTVNLIKRLVVLVTGLVALYHFYQYLTETGMLDEVMQRYKKLIASANVNGDSLAQLVSTVIDPKVKSAKYSSQPAKTYKTAIRTNAPKMNPRARVMLTYIKQRNKLTLPEIRDKFPTVTSRTLRRDLDKLEQLGYVIQEGKTRGSLYRYTR